MTNYYIPEFVIASIVVIIVIYLTMKLIDMWRMKRLRKKFPEGTETQSKPVSRLDKNNFVRSPNPENTKPQIDAEDAVKQLLD